MTPSDEVTTTTWSEQLGLRRRLVLDGGQQGRALCRSLSDATDEVLRGLFEEAAAGPGGRLALVAVGGYGRGSSHRAATSTSGSSTTGGPTWLRWPSGSGTRSGTPG